MSGKLEELTEGERPFSLATCRSQGSQGLLATCAISRPKGRVSGGWCDETARIQVLLCIRCYECRSVLVEELRRYVGFAVGGRSPPSRSGGAMQQSVPDVEQPMLPPAFHC